MGGVGEGSRGDGGGSNEAGSSVEIEAVMEGLERALEEVRVAASVSRDVWARVSPCCISFLGFLELTVECSYEGSDADAACFLEVGASSASRSEPEVPEASSSLLVTCLHSLGPLNKDTRCRIRV